MKKLKVDLFGFSLCVWNLTAATLNLLMGYPLFGILGYAVSLLVLYVWIVTA